jgi:PilZ domain
MNEQRKAPRHRVYKAGTIEFSGSAIPCLVRNLSTSGAVIEVSTPLWFPDRFTLGIPSDGTRQPCHIVWRHEKSIGLAFE